MKRKLIKIALAMVVLEITTTAIAGTYLANKWPELKPHVPSQVAAAIDQVMER